MTDHTHRDIEHDLNGFGKRVNEVEVSLGKNDVKTQRNAEDITKLFTLVGEVAQTANKIEKSLAGLIGKIAGVVAAASVFVAVIIRLGEHLLGK
jgi:hypothetical protein